MQRPILERLAEAKDAAAAAIDSGAAAAKLDAWVEVTALVRADARGSAHGVGALPPRVARR